MQRMGLGDDELELYHATLRSSHVQRVRVFVTNMEGEVLSTVSRGVKVLDGAVTVDGQADVTRSLSLSLLDARHSLNFDTDSPDDGAIYVDRMVRVDYGVDVPALGGWVDCTVFHGPVTSLSRTEDVVEVEAQGKEALAMGDMWRPLNLVKSTRKGEAIRTILKERAGESRFAVNSSAGGRLGDPLSLAADRTPWEHARALARSMEDRQLFYDGRGVCVLREFPDRVLYGFKDASDGHPGDVLTPLTASYSTDVVNTVVVKGRKPKDKNKPAPRAVAVAGQNSPLSPARLGRNGVPRHLVERVESNKVSSQQEAERTAKKILDNRLLQSVEVSFDALRVPHLDPGDKVSVSTSAGTFEFRLWQFMLPLSAGAMNVGYTKRRRLRKGGLRK